jgi:hypothetical protein
MNDSIHGEVAQEKKDAGTLATESIARGDTPAATIGLKSSAELARAKELEDANARLLQLVGELLVANQKLRERCAS